MALSVGGVTWNGSTSACAVYNPDPGDAFTTVHFKAYVETTGGSGTTFGQGEKSTLIAGGGTAPFSTPNKAPSGTYASAVAYLPDLSSSASVYRSFVGL